MTFASSGGWRTSRSVRSSRRSGEPMAEPRPAVFLDRDGVLNYNRRDHIKSPDELVLIPGAAEAVAALKQAGWVVIIVSNQSGLARGLFRQEALAAITAKLCAALEAA